jgi:hypothetical protein
LLNSTPLILNEHRSVLKVVRFQHAHTRIAICIPKRLCGEPSPVSTQLAFASCCTRRYVVPLGFCCGGFSSTAGYVPGNEAQVRRHERRSTRSADQVRGALLVFIRVTGKVFRLFPQAFRLRPWRPSSGFPLLLLSNGASPHPFHLQVSVKTPVSNFDCVMDSTRDNLSVKYKIL